MKKIIIGQSGWPTAVINSSIAWAYVKAKELWVEKVYGMIHWIEWFLQEKFIDLDEYLNNEENIELLKRTPSAFLWSCRYKLPKIEDKPEIYEQIFSILEKNEIDALFYTGGNDSMDTIKMLSDYAQQHNKPQKFMGIPKTIDNDLPITDHCPWYWSAAKYIASSLKEIIRDNASFGASKPTICIVEIMWRHAWRLTAAAALAKWEDCEWVDAIYLPETVFNIENFKKIIKELSSKKSSIVIAVSEWIMTSDWKFVCEIWDENKQVDAFWHKQLWGTAICLANIVSKEIWLKTRAIEFSTLQRAATHLASLTDINEAFAVWARAVEEANKWNTWMMVIITRKNWQPYESSTDIYDIHNIANIEKKVPESMIDTENHSLTQEYLNYAKPLIQWELTPIFKDWLPTHLIRKQ